jgi:para-aminobenzoate synthetase/4-amino-4-deoxychorismate lyase
MSALPHADPGWGVFETMLVLAGRPVELDAHLERLGASLAALYGAPLPPGARAAVLAAAQPIDHGKLRVTVAPAGGLRVAAEGVEPAAVFPAAGRGVELRSVTVAGGLGEHKWADRRLLRRAELGHPARRLALLLDADGTVLEASRASVFMVEGDGLATPAADGRILPSIARRQAIEVARAAGVSVCERDISLAELGGEAFLTGSVRGVEPVAAIDGRALPPPGELSALVAAGLRERWLAAPAAEPAAAAAGARPAGPPGR